ncbi:MAG TPA: CHAD domain-containing protein, partial [Gammaproteobacteria bacterium]|nr:CHAD domain-containing protein [Gammaproteobacteria bacterium]
RHKAPALEQLLGGIVGVEDRGDAEHWHGIRILLKRYHHTLEAFDLCPGHRRDEAELSQIGMLEQLLGDWHDRVITAEILQALPRREKQCAPAIAELGRQQALLLGSARIYLARYTLRKTATWRDPGCTG